MHSLSPQSKAREVQRCSAVPRSARMMMMINDDDDENGHDKDVFVCDVIQMFHMILTIHVKDITIENIFINSISFPYFNHLVRFAANCAFCGCI